jgi:hypothetical protein
MKKENNQGKIIFLSKGKSFALEIEKIIEENEVNKTNPENLKNEEIKKLIKEKEEFEQKNLKEKEEFEQKKLKEKEEYLKKYEQKLKKLGVESTDKEIKGKFII